MVSIGISGGMQEQTREDSEAISTSSVILAPARLTFPVRKVIVIRNVSPNAIDTISISFGDTKKAIVNKGIVLKQNESFVDASSEGYQAFQGQIQGICATINGVVAIFER